MFVFQQDNAPAHRARDRVELLRRETPQFISPDMWPVNSPDLNSRLPHLGHAATACVSSTNPQKGTSCGSILLRHGLSFSRAWRKTLEACIRAEGSHFEHLLLLA